MKKHTLKLLSFIALSAITTQAKAQFTPSSPVININAGYDDLRFAPSSTGNVRSIRGNTDNYLEINGNYNQNDGPAIILHTNQNHNTSPTSKWNTWATPGSIILTTKTPTTSTDPCFQILSNPFGTSTFTSPLKVYSNGNAEVSHDLKVNGSAYAWDLSAQGNGYVNNTLKVGTTTTTGVVDCNGTVYTWDMLAHGNGYVENQLKVGTPSTTGTIDCNGTVTTWDLLAHGNGYIDGYVRIGNAISLPGTGNTTTPPPYKLYVQTGILTEKIKVAMSSDPNNWRDFVFDENYDLKPLAEVEKFIQKNKHLPEIPSTSEVHENGLDLAEMDAKLLQKVEELTLYVIQQQKEINELKKKLK